MPKIVNNAKTEIMQATKDILSTKGYTQFNLRDVALACNVGMRTIYNYYPSKEHLLTDIIHWEWNKFLLEVELIICDQNEPLFKLEQIYIKLRELVNNHSYMKEDVYLSLIHYSNHHGLSHKQSIFKRQLSEKITKILCEYSPIQDKDFSTSVDTITSNLISYSQKSDFNFNTFKNELTKITA